jgi:apoptosis-inducing factor 3
VDGSTLPFFWSQHYDVRINYVGHAGKWDSISFDGDPGEGNCAATFTTAGKKTAVVTTSRDLESLRAELDMENTPASHPV